MVFSTPSYALEFRAADAPASATLQLRAMTFNLKYASAEGDHRWSARRRLVRNAILSQRPDVIGTQEGVHAQLRDLAADLPDYGWVGQGREGGRQGEFSAIFYRKDRFRLVEHGNFWLSATPETPGSRSWGNLIPRMVTWALLEDRASGERFYHYNTHFDHLIPYSRSKSAELLTRRIAGRKLPAPVIVTGDFNTGQGSKPYRILTPAGRGATALADSWDLAGELEGRRISTYHGWRGPSQGNRRIDWILASKDFACARARVVLYHEHGAWPSDHFPVVSDLRLKGPSGYLIAQRQASGAGVTMTAN